jgi:hypothetical protein
MVRAVRAATPSTGHIPLVGLDLSGMMLADAVAAIVAHLAAGNGLGIDGGGPEGRTNVECSLAVTRSGLGWIAALTATTSPRSQKEWTIYYEALRQGRARTLLNDRRAAAPDRLTEERVSHRTFWALAACLRGDAAAAQDALAWWTRIVVRREREWMDRPEVRIHVGDGTVGILEPDYEYLRALLDSAEREAEERAELLGDELSPEERQELAALRAVANVLLEERDHGLMTNADSETERQDAKPRRGRRDRDRRYAAAARRRRR